MAERKFYTAFNRPPLPAFEHVGGVSETSTLGYADHNHLIQSILHTGDVVKFLRGAEYDIRVDSSVPDEDVPLPETRQRGFGLYELGLLKRKLDDYLASKTGSSRDIGPSVESKAVDPVEVPPVTAEGSPSES